MVNIEHHIQDDADIYPRIGRKLKQLRSENGLTQAQTAQIIDVSAQQYQKYEDARNKCSLNNLAALAKHFGISLSELLGDEHEAQMLVERETPQRPASPSQHLARDADLVARLVSAYVRLPSVGEQRRIVELLEEIAEAHARDRQ